MMAAERRITNYVSQLHGRMASTGRQPTTQPKPLKDGLPLAFIAALMVSFADLCI
jgi:hypothetical protein